MNVDLPITGFHEEIVRAVSENPVVIITAETGAGKSTQVPQYLYEEGYTIVSTQPRRVAAEWLADRVAVELGGTLGDVVGFRTGVNRCDSANTRILFCTDGLQLVRELTGKDLNRQVLIIDEVHEWNRNIEALVAWSKRQLSLGATFKVVLMSATVEAEKLSDYFDQAPIVSVPGRLHPVEQLTRLGSPAEVAVSFVREGRNVLVFVSGKSEIQEVMTEITSMGLLNVEVLPLHAGLSPEERNKARDHYQVPKIIVATNLAQTSVTIDDIDAVVDTGKEKRAEAKNGIDGLAIGDISQADCEQRKGRAGRTKPGYYVLASSVPLEERPKFSTPEILRNRLDQLVLRFKDIGLDATELHFFHQPSLDSLFEAMKALRHLEALDSEDKVTKTGRAMSLLPVDVHYARMIVESKELGVLGPMLTIVACLQARGVRGKGRKIDGEYVPPRWPWLTKEHNSDLLAELDCFIAASKMTKKEMFENDIIAKNYFEAKEIRERLCRDLGCPLDLTAPFDRMKVIRASSAGMVDHLYHGVYGGYSGIEGSVRQLDRNSVVNEEEADWVTATAYDLEYTGTNRRGETYTGVVNLLNDVSRVDPHWFLEIAPSLVEHLPVGFRYVPELNEVMEVTEVLFNGLTVDYLYAPSTACPEATLALAKALEKRQIDYPQREQNDEIRGSYYRYWITGLASEVTKEEIVDFFVERLGQICSVKDLAEVDLLIKLDRFSDISPRFPVLEPVPDPETIEVDGVSCDIRYHRPSYSRYIYATLTVRQGDLNRLLCLPDLPNGVEIERIIAIDQDGRHVAQGVTLYQVRNEIALVEQKIRRDAEERVYLDQIAGFRAKASELEAKGLYVKQLGLLINELSLSVGLSYGYYTKSTNNSRIRQETRKIEVELERLQGDPIELFIDELVSGRLRHPDVDANKALIRKLEALHIRSDGFIDVPTESEMRVFYRTRLEGVTKVSEVLGRDLKLSVDDYAPDDILNELPLASNRVALNTRKGTKQYPVLFGYEDIDGERVAVGVIPIPVVVYEANCVDVGRRSNFPVFSCGIRLILEVTEEDKVVARGEDTDQLKSQIKRYKKGKKHTGNGTFVQPEQAPPWHRGRTR